MALVALHLLWPWDTPHLVRNIVAQVAAEESEVVMVPCEERGVLPDLDQSEVSTVVT